MSLNRKFRTIIALITAVCFSYNSYAASSVVVESLYNYAHNKQISKIRYMLNTMGYNIDVEDEDGVTAWCIAKESNDTCAMGVLEQMGANTEQRCGLPWGYIGAAAGVLAVGGIAAAMGGGGGGGGGDSDPCSGVVCGDNQHCLKGSCICDEGYLEFDGVCYADLNCSIQINSDGTQNKDKCSCINGFSGTLCNECTGVLGNDGICYEKLDCGEDYQGYQQNGKCICQNNYSGNDCRTCNGHDENEKCWNSLDCGDNGHQENNKCVCENGYTGNDCRTCNGRIGADGKCYTTLDCKNESTQVNDKCVCINGYSGTLCDVCEGGFEQFGQCFTKLECQNGSTQSGNSCNCINGYSGKLCNVCNGTVQNGICYEVLNCQNGGIQEETTCNCINGYSGTYCESCHDGNGYEEGGVCYEKLNCQNGSTQSGNSCNCINGYSGNLCDVCDGIIQDDICYEELSCNEPYGNQVGDECICTDGYTGYDCSSCETGYGHYGSENECFATLESCIHGTQEGNTCVCNGYWSGEDCNTCNGHIEEDACYQALDCGYGTQVGNTCQCNAGYYRDGTGKCVSESDNVTMNTFDGNNNFMFNEAISKTQENYGDVYGLVYSANTSNPSDHITGSQSDMYINYLDNSEESNNVVNTRTLTLNNLGDGNVYGMKSTYANNMYMTYLDLTATVAQGSQTTEITINNGGEIKNTQGLVTGGNGNVYGIYSDYYGTNIYNMAQDLGSDISNTLEMSSILNITSIGSGDVFGMYKNDDGNLNNGLYDVQTGENFVTDNAVINVTSTGTGNVVAMYSGYYGDVINSGVLNVSSNTGTATGIYLEDGSVTNTGKIDIKSSGEAIGVQTYHASVNNRGTIDVINNGQNNYSYGIYTYDGTLYSPSMIKNSSTGMLTVENNANSGDIYGIYTSADVAYIINEGEIEVINSSNSDDDYTYGIYGNADASVVNSNSITVEGQNGHNYGIRTSMFDGDYETTNNGSINVSSASGNLYGIYSETKVVNTNSIIVSTANGVAYGIYGEYANIDNKGTISVSSANGEAYGIYANGGNVTNSETINASGTEGNIFGIYATNGATVTNTGTIKLNSDTCDGSTCDGSSTYYNFIVLDTGSLFLNRGLTVSSSSLDFDDNNGTVALGKGGKFKASSISGKLAVDTSVVEDGFDDTYVENEALQSSNIDVNVTSNSAMFDASVQNNDGKDSANIVLTRKSFDELSASSSIAKFLETNYNQQNNESLFNVLKKASLHTYSAVEAQNLGYGLLPNFAHENLNVLRNLNSTLNDELFETTGTIRKIVGYDSLYQSRDTKGTLTGYENYANTMYFMYDKELDNLVRTGLGMSITQFSSDYDDDSNRKEVMAQMLVPVSYIADNISYASIARLGYADGKYERQTPNGKFESDLTSWIYGLSNQARYNMDLGFMELEPTVEFNVLGYYQNRIRENKNKIGAIKADGENNLSLEAGIGLNAKKDVKFDKNNKLSFKASAMYYHEFAKPYHSLEASFYNMPGTYKITDYENIYDRDRAMLSFGLDYSYKPFTIYGKFRQFIEDENPFEANAGIKYNF